LNSFFDTQDLLSENQIRRNFFKKLMLAKIK